MSDASVVDRPSYLARPMIINPAGKRVESTSCQQRKGEIIYLLVDPQEKKDIDDRRVIAVKKNPLCIEFSIDTSQIASKCSGRFQWAR